MRVGTLALMSPVITSTEGRCVARIMWMPDARAFWARRAISSSTFLPTIIIMSASSSMITTINGSGVSVGCSMGFSSSISSGGVKVGSLMGLPAAIASLTLRL